MSNGHVCCILGVCCPPGMSPDEPVASSAAGVVITGTDKRKSHALHEELVEAGVGDVEEAAAWVIAHFDLAPKGALTPLLEALRPEFGKYFNHK